MNDNPQKMPPVPPFVRFVASAVPMVFDNSLSYYEALCALWKYIQSMTDVINNNATLEEEYIEKFNELKSFVDHYFDDLDVQEEINNKLDQMAEDGQLADIISQYLNSTAVFGYDNVAEMKAAQNLVNGSYARTLGYYAKNDSGSALYKIRTITNDDTIDNASIIEMGDGSNNLIAELIVKDQINPVQFGCHGDGVTDDTTNLQKAINYAESKKVLLTSDGNKEYLITSTLNVDKLECQFNNATITSNSRIDLITINSNNYYGNIQAIRFDCTNARSAIYIANGRKKSFSNLIIENVGEYGFYYNGGYEVSFKDSHITAKPNSSNTIGIFANSSDSHFTNIILIDCDTAIYANGSNFYDKIHGWILTSSKVAGSIFAHLKSECSFFTQCYSDTYYEAFLLDGGYFICDELRTFFNTTIYTIADNPILINKTSNATFSHQIRSSVTNSQIQGMIGKSINFVPTLPSNIKVNNNDLSRVLNYDGGIVGEMRNPSSAVTSVLVNKLTLKNGIASLDLVFQMDTSVSTSYSFDFPLDFPKPQYSINTVAGTGTTQWNLTGTGYLYLQNNLQGSTQTANSFVKIHLQYVIANENS